MTTATPDSAATADASPQRRTQSLRVLCWVLSGIAFVVGPLIGMTVNAEFGAAIWVSSAVLALLPFYSHRHSGSRSRISASTSEQGRMVRFRLTDHPVAPRGRAMATGTIWVPPAVRPFLALGIGAVVAGGLVAAVSRPAGWERGSWSAAFLVLVVGIGQVGLAIGQSAFGRRVVSARTIVVELGLVNLGASLVVAGTLSSSPIVATIGSLLFGAAIAVFANHSRGRRRYRSWLQRVYLALLAVLAVSAPIGIALSWLRA